MKTEDQIHKKIESLTKELEAIREMRREQLIYNKEAMDHSLNKEFEIRARIDSLYWVLRDEDP